MQKLARIIANIVIFTALALTVMAITDRAADAGWLQESPVTTACEYVVNAVGEKFDEEYAQKAYSCGVKYHSREAIQSQIMEVFNKYIQ